jgi:hypothetical protein
MPLKKGELEAVCNSQLPKAGTNIQNEPQNDIQTGAVPNRDCRDSASMRDLQMRATPRRRAVREPPGR